MTARPARCPSCRKAVEGAPVNPHFPFCSQRCRTLDLGRWLDGAYAVPVQGADDDEDGDGAPRPAEPSPPR